MAQLECVWVLYYSSEMSCAVRGSLAKGRENEIKVPILPLFARWCRRGLRSRRSGWAVALTLGFWSHFLSDYLSHF